MCVCLCVCLSLATDYDTAYKSVRSASAQKINGDFPETVAFELEKLAVKLPGPTHQLMLRMRIYTLTVLRGIRILRVRVGGASKGNEEGDLYTFKYEIVSLHCVYYIIISHTTLVRQGFFYFMDLWLNNS